MAKQANEAGSEAQIQKRKIVEEKKELKNEQKKQRAEVKKRAKEISKRESELAEEDEGNGFLTFFATLLIVLVWLAVIAVIIKLDVGGFGSNVLTPILKDVPIVNKILPKSAELDELAEESYGGYSSLQEAVKKINELELALDSVQSTGTSKDEEIANLKAEILRLQEFEDKQVEFQRIKTEFFEEVVYAENGPGAEEYTKYYEAMDPTTAEYLYKQVIAQLEETQEVQDYAAAYSAMKPKQAATIFEAMTDNLELAARILNVMSSEDRGAILGVMDSTVSAKLTKIMDPES